MSVDENKALVRREQAELWNHTGNLDAAAELFAPDRVEDAKQEAANVRRGFPDLELPAIGWQLFILGSSQNDSTAFPSFLDTYATRLLPEALSGVISSWRTLGGSALAAGLRAINLSSTALLKARCNTACM